LRPKFSFLISMPAKMSIARNSSFERMSSEMRSSSPTLTKWQISRKPHIGNCRVTVIPLI
jgi:hypothetical protein